MNCPAGACAGMTRILGAAAAAADGTLTGFLYAACEELAVALALVALLACELWLATDVPVAGGRYAPLVCARAGAALLPLARCEGCVLCAAPDAPACASSDAVSALLASDESDAERLWKLCWCCAWCACGAFWRAWSRCAADVRAGTAGS